MYIKTYIVLFVCSIIFPQNRKGEPEYNPCGKYTVKLHINGVPRKVFKPFILQVSEILILSKFAAKQVLQALLS